MIIHWYPGHMAKAERIVREQMKAIDVVIELRDARIPNSSANPVIKNLTQNKPRILVLNKADLADEAISSIWKEHFKQEINNIIFLDSKAKRSRSILIKTIKQVGEPLLLRWRKRGLRSRSLRTVILGIPNVGKSTLINTMARGYIAQTANRPGKTRGQQWIKIDNQLELMDTPGILWPKLDDQDAAKRLAITGAIADEIFDSEEVVRSFIEFAQKNYPGNLAERYQIDEEPSDPDTWLELIATRRGCLLAGGRIDTERARQIIMDDFRRGSLGRMTLERPEDGHEE